MIIYTYIFINIYIFDGVNRIIMYKESILDSLYITQDIAMRQIKDIYLTYRVSDQQKVPI